MALINITLQGKGGVGKSYINFLLVQYYLKLGAKVQGFDTDPVNHTLGSFEALPIEIVQLGERQDKINPRYFDYLVEKILAMPEDGVCVVDNGSSTFLPLLGYLVESQVLELLREAGHEIRLHAVLAGGQAVNDTMTGFSQILTYLPDVPVVVWLNQYFGRIERRLPKGGVQTFEETKLYKDNKDRIFSLVRLPEVNPETFGHDIAQMMQAHLSFAEAVASEDFALMARQRLKKTWETLYEAIVEAKL